MDDDDRMTDLALKDRDGLPDALRVLLADYPRDQWASDPGFDGLVRFWLDRHLMFRKLLANLQDDAEALLDARMDPQRYVAGLSRYGGMFVNGLHEHHTIEDTYYFPTLSQRDTRISRGFDILDRDHHDIDDYLNSFVAAANGTIKGLDDRDKLQNEVGHLRSEVLTLTALLNRHLTDEEELIVPVILKFGTAGLG
ncbi:hemerythrin domain-containing protein [Yoonia sp. SS1-5]|uniref:Hemerythrin domain-containing protein n=1 Tax=Yoonia rhodophyticola TaxID=3137370 RepID=A0AAN0NLY4_9RHOB